MVALHKKAGWSDKKKNTEEDVSLSEMTTDDLLWGTNTVLEALRKNARSLGELLIQKGKAGPKIQEIIDLAREHKVRVRFIEAERLPVPRNCRHQGVVARQTEAELLPLEELLEQALANSDRILILDSIQDPRNLEFAVAEQPSHEVFLCPPVGTLSIGLASQLLFGINRQ
ncbi:MAG: hypothetical protein D3917_02720 [Candidatus Electrothrix sp. AX5]|nr:hypothetical protein [Candidatus Electrothrix sp. AX5]